MDEETMNNCSYGQNVERLSRKKIPQAPLDNQSQEKTGNPVKIAKKNMTDSVMKQTIQDWNTKVKKSHSKVTL